MCLTVEVEKCKSSRGVCLTVEAERCRSGRGVCLTVSVTICVRLHGLWSERLKRLFKPVISQYALFMFWYAVSVTDCICLL